MLRVDLEDISREDMIIWIRRKKVEDSREDIRGRQKEGLRCSDGDG